MSLEKKKAEVGITTEHSLQVGTYHEKSQ